MLILGNEVQIDTAPVHIAPGGSILCTLKGDAGDIAAMLRALREEIAFGMCDASAQNAPVSVSVYFGAADRPDFDNVIKNFDKLAVELADMPEGTAKTGFTMAARNRVIDALGK